MISTKALEKILRVKICARVRELYEKYLSNGQELLAELVKDSFKECFGGE